MQAVWAQAVTGIQARATAVACHLSLTLTPGGPLSLEAAGRLHTLWCRMLSKVCVAQADSSAAAQSHIMQALTHAARTGVLEGRIWGRLGKASTLGSDLGVKCVRDIFQHLYLGSANHAT
jgi:hypothetical protein